MKTIYLDTAASTRVSPEVLQRINEVETTLYFNSSALSVGSLCAKNEIEKANLLIKTRLTKNGKGTLIFTGGATEANNIAILGKITAPRHNLVIMDAEHSSVYNVAKHLREIGNKVDICPIHPNGLVDLTALATLVNENTTMVCFAYCNSDTGCRQNAEEIVAVVRARAPQAHIHSDAVQAFCKFNFDVEKLGLDSATICAHKLNGPKGVGALWLREGARLAPRSFGGQNELHPGTQNNAGILGFAKAVEIWDTEKNFAYITKLHDLLLANLPKGVTVNGINNNPYTTNLTVPFLGNTIMNALGTKGIYVGLGAACSASSNMANRTLTAMGFTPEQTKKVLRISYDTLNTEDDILTFVAELGNILKTLP
jgi:cysteine desulfurase